MFLRITDLRQNESHLIFGYNLTAIGNMKWSTILEIYMWVVKEQTIISFKKCEINDVVDDTEGDLDFKESDSRAQKKVIHTNCDINETSDSTKSGWLYFL